MFVDFAICMECDLIADSKTLFKLVCKFLLPIGPKIACTFDCHQSLRHGLVISCRVWFARVAILHAKLSWEVLLSLGTSCGFAKMFPGPKQPSLPILLVIQTFLPHKDSLHRWTFWAMSKSALPMLTKFLDNSFTSTRYIVFFDSDWVHSNKRNYISFQMNGIYLPEKKNKENIKKRNFRKGFRIDSKKETNHY